MSKQSAELQKDPFLPEGLLFALVVAVVLPLLLGLFARPAETPGPLQPKAMLMLAQTFTALENPSLARQILENVVSGYSETMFADEARRMLSQSSDGMQTS